MAVNIVVPEMGESIVDARVSRWLKNEGDAVATGDPLVELETDKVDVEVSAPRNGVLQKITQPAGSDVKIGEVLGGVEVLVEPQAGVRLPVGERCRRVHRRLDEEMARPESLGQDCAGDGRE